MSMTICKDCGARNYIRDEWQGGDSGCRHWHRDTMISERLVSELKLMLTSYRPEEIVAAAQQLCAGR